MQIAIVLDRPLQEAQDLVDQPLQFLQEMKRVLDDKKSHPVLERMLRTIQDDAAKQDAASSKERLYYTGDIDDNQFQYCRGTSKCLQSCWGLEKLVLVS